MNTGTDLTFDLLATTPNAAAERLLALSLRSRDWEVRRRAIEAGLHRRSRATVMQILRTWDELTDAELRTIQEHPTAMQPFVAEVLRDPESPLWLVALDAVRMLNLNSMLPLVIDRLEPCSDGRLRNRMLATVLDLGTALGDAAHHGRERPSARGPVVNRLAESVRNFNRHRCPGLCDAFLAASCWGDRGLRLMLTDDPHTMRLLAHSLLTSPLPGVIHLLAGYIRRQQIPSVVQRALEQREDVAFRDALLTVIGDSPPRVAIRNIRNSKPLACLSDYATLAARTPARYHAALVHAHTAHTRDAVAQLTLILDVISRGSRRVDGAVISAFHNLESFDSATMTRSATAVADLDLDFVANDALAQLVWRMVQMLDHPDEAVVAGLREVMRPLHIEHVLSLVENLSGANPARLGGLLCRIDPQTVQTIGDELRNPVLARRCRAIKAAVACNAVDALADLLIHSAIHDHREARLMAIAALGLGTSPRILATLNQLADGPQGAVRDAASEALLAFENRSAPAALPVTIMYLPYAMNAPLLHLLVQAPLVDAPAGVFATVAGIPGWGDGVRSLLPYVVLTALPIAVAVGIGMAYQYIQQRRGAVDSPERLFRELCRIHAIRSREERLLRKLARTASVKDPAELLVIPEHFETACTAAGRNLGSSEMETVEVLRQRLFTADPSAPRLAPTSSSCPSPRSLPF